MQFAIGIVIGLALGAGALFLVQKSKIDHKDREIKQLNRKIEELDRDYESRMQQNISSLQKDYEQRSNQKIEALKKQYQEVKQSYEIQIRELEEKSHKTNLLIQQEYEQKIQDYKQQIQEYEQQLAQVNEALFSQEEAIADQQTVAFSEISKAIFKDEEALSDETMDELLQLLDETP